MRVNGHVRGYISGMVDAEFDGILRGQLDANVSNGAAVTEINEDGRKFPLTELVQVPLGNDI